MLDANNLSVKVHSVASLHAYIMELFGFFAASDLVVVDYNSEMADVVNPRGAIFGEAWYVYAENVQGDRWRYYLGIDCKEKAEKLAHALNMRMLAGKLPVAFDRWEQHRPAYGSPAYVAYGQADDLAWERQCDEIPF